MKAKHYLVVSITVLLFALIFVDTWLTAVLRTFLANVILYPLALVFPTALKKVLLSTGVIGNGFSAIVYVGANFPSLWKIASDSFLSSTPNQDQFIHCPSGNNFISLIIFISEM